LCVLENPELPYTNFSYGDEETTKEVLRLYGERKRPKEEQ